MSLEKVLLAIAAAAFLASLAWWIRREQSLASSSITITSRELSRERMEELFVKHVANNGRDRWGVFDDHIATQPNHFRWTLALDFLPTHEESGGPVTVAYTRHKKAYFTPFPHQQLQLYQVIERWDEQARRMRGLIRAVRDADPDANIDIDSEMFE